MAPNKKGRTSSKKKNKGRSDRQQLRSAEPAAVSRDAETNRDSRSQHMNDLSRASQSGDDYTDPNKYIVARTDFRRVSRWPNDGIEKERQSFLDGSTEHHVMETTDEDQLALTELFGGWMMGKPLSRNPMERSFPLSLPWMMQQQAAKELQRNSELSEQAAVEYILDAYRNKDKQVRELLEKIGCKSAIHKASRDSTRFPNFYSILVPLLQQNLGSQQNIEILFGKVERVLPTLMEVGSLIADPPPANSPAGAYLASFMGISKAPPAQKQCAECGTTEGNIRGCVGCNKSVHYCSKDCQTSNWVLHKPACLEAQGKAVPESVILDAKQSLAERENKAKARASDESQKHAEMVHDNITAFINEGPEKVDTFSHTCHGKRRRADLPWTAEDVESMAASFLGLRMEQTLTLGMFPDGIDNRRGLSGRGVLLSNPENGAKIIVLHERLFADGGDGNKDGHAIEGIFVVDKVVRSSNRAKWREVSAPSSYPKGSNRFKRFKAYLARAKEQAKAIPQDIDLGIHNPPDPMLSFTPTAYGDMLNVKF